MKNKMIIGKDEIKLIGFEKVQNKMTLVFYENGLAIIPDLHKQTIKNYPMSVDREGEMIRIQDKDLLDILEYRKTPTEVEFIATDSGYVALVVE